MPPKKTAAQAAPAEVVEQEPIQAVVLADSFNRRFEVLCVDKPRCLLPLLGIPMLAWTLESLSLSNVSEVIIFCGAHADAIKDFVQSSPYSRTLSIQCVTSKSAISPGDALRQLDAMQVLNPKSPFILLQSPIVSSFDLSKVVKAHKERKEADKDLIMTMAIGTGGRSHPESPLMLVDPSKSLLLHYAQLPAFPPKARYSIPTSLILDVKDPRNLDYEVWGGKGFRDLGIDICEADVPAQFTENFDWQDMRRHLVCGVLMSELLGKRIGVYKVGAEIGYSAPKDDADKQESTDQAGHSDARTYVERIRDTRTFADVSRDVLRRWSFPLVPDSGILGAGDFELRRGGIYVARDGVVLARTTSLSGPLLLGPSTYLATNTSVRRSVLGRNNRVAARTTICDSYLFDNVIVGKNCKIEGCIIGDDVVLEDGVTIEKGALLGNGVRVGQGQTIEAFARVGKTAKMTPCIEGDEEEAADEQDEGMCKLPGETSIGFIWPVEEVDLDSDDELEDPYEHPDNKRLLELGRSLDDLSIAESSVSTLSHASTSEQSSAGSSDAGDDDMTMGKSSAAREFPADARAIMDRIIEEGISNFDATMELLSLSLTAKVGITGPGGIREVLVAWIMDQIDVESGNGAAVQVASDRIWEKYGEILVKNNCHESGLVDEVQKYCVQHQAHGRFFPYFVKSIYEEELAQPEQIIEWYKQPRSRGVGVLDEERASQLQTLWERCTPFIKAMVAAEQEDDSDEDEDEESDEE